MCGKEVALSSGEVILRQSGDLFEELRACLVIEEPGGKGLLWGGKTRNGFMKDCRVYDGESSGDGHRSVLNS
jgi:hypothetical protein